MRSVDRIKMFFKTDPFPHAVVHEFFHPTLYAKLEKEFPDPELVVGGRDKKSNILLQYHACSVLADHRISQAWRQVFAEHTSLAFFKRLSKAIGLESYHPELESSSFGIRYLHDTQIQMDCLFGVNTPVKETSSVKGPHLDNPREIYACLIYFPVPGDTAGGDMILYQYTTDAPKLYGKQYCDDVEEIGVVPYKPNTAIFFVNTPRSLHGVGPREKTDVYRRYCNIEAEFHKPLFNLPRA